MKTTYSRATIIALLVISSILLTIFGPLLIWMSIVYGGYVLEPFLPGDIPVYDNLEIELRDNLVETVTIASPTANTEGIYVVLANNVIVVDKLTQEDVIALGYHQEPGRYISGEISPTTPYGAASFSANSLKYIRIAHNEIEFSNSPNGPFLRVGCTFDEFKKVFGKPKSWRRRTNKGWF